MTINLGTLEDFIMRFVDKNYGSEAHFEIIDSGVCVVCPKCKGMGTVKGEREADKYYLKSKSIYFKCSSCYAQAHIPTKYKYQANAVCIKCGRYIKKDISEEHKGHNILNIVCPHCEAVVPAKTQEIESMRYYYSGISVKGISAIEPNFGYELYFLSSFKGKAVFARNRIHLQYLIDYIGADLRIKESPLGGMMRRVPSFMKLGKNRNDMLKLLKKLQGK